MSNVAWVDDSVRVRLFQTGVQVAAHFFEALHEVDVSSEKNLLEHVEDLNRRWLTIAEESELEIAQYTESMVKQLAASEGRPLFDHMRLHLAKPFSRDARIWQVNQAALKELSQCIQAWGGPKAKRRIAELKLLPLSCQTAADDDTHFSFNRQNPSIQIEAGSPTLMLFECLFLEFSFFHEYLSHALPAWSTDFPEISEGFLFALEFEWLQTKYTLFDNDLVQRVWHPRLEKERRAFRTGQWLFRRCSSYECIGRFLLEWVAGWNDFSEEDHKNLIAQLNGLYNKGGSEFGIVSAKAKKMQDLLHKLLCDPCPNGTWNIQKIQGLLGNALDGG